MFFTWNKQIKLAKKSKYKNQRLQLLVYSHSSGSPLLTHWLSLQFTHGGVQLEKNLKDGQQDQNSKCFSVLKGVAKLNKKIQLNKRNSISHPST